MVILTTGFWILNFPAFFLHFGNLNFPHFLTFLEFQFEFSRTLIGLEQKRKSTRKFKFAESCSEYHHFIHYLCSSLKMRPILVIFIHCA